MQKFAAIRRFRWPLTGALLGALVFVALYGVQVLNPASVDWILNNPSPDPSQHYLGWAFFRQSPVHLPYIGANYSNIYPYRTSVLFTDSIPLLALLFKCLGPILPARSSISAGGALPATRCRAVSPRPSWPGWGASVKNRLPAAGLLWWGLVCWCCFRP